MSRTDFLKIPATVSTVIGVTGLATGLYNIAADGERHIHESSKEEITDHYVDMYMKNQLSSKDSTLLEKIKNYTTNQRLDAWIFPFYYNAKNCITATVHEIINNSMLFGLSAVTAVTPFLFNRRAAKIQPKIDSINKMLKKIHLKTQLSDAKTLGKKIGGASAIILTLSALNVFRKEVLGIGKNVE